jgi:Dpy-30 motif
MNKPTLLTVGKRLGFDDTLYLVSVYDLEPAGIIVSAYNQINSKEYLLPISEMEVSVDTSFHSIFSRNITVGSRSVLKSENCRISPQIFELNSSPSLKGLIQTISLVPQAEDLVLQSYHEKISNIKRRPKGEELEEMMKTPMTEGGDSIHDLLVTAMMELCKEKPTGLDAVQWLGEWLIKNNPNKPLINDPDEE